MGLGSNTSGQLGDGTNIDKNIPVQINNDNDWTKISSTGSYAVALKSNGSLWAWGNNSVGQLGDGTNVNKNMPVQIGTQTDWLDITTGELFTIALKNN
jgi:alpha-tubulin suppressor-like RCC1 family protein